MIPFGEPKKFFAITDSQAESLEEAIDMLMRLDIGVRCDLLEYIVPDHITSAIIRLVEEFSGSNENLEKSFEETGVRHIAKMKKESMSKGSGGN